MTSSKDIPEKFIVYADCDEHQISRPDVERKFHPVRKWRFDYAWPEYLIAVEVEGGAFSRPVKCNHCNQFVTHRTKTGKTIKVMEGGRHNTGKGFTNDLEKYQAAFALGWRVLRVSPKQARNGEAIEIIARIIQKIEKGKFGHEIK